MSNSYTVVGPGSVVNAAFPAYTAIVLSADESFYWPSAFVDSANVIAAIMNVAPTGNGLTLTIDDATHVSVGQSILFINTSAFSFNVLDNTGGVITAMAAGQTRYIILDDNTNPDGTWIISAWGGGYTAVNSVGVSVAATIGNLTLGGPNPITSSGIFLFGLGADLASLAGFGAGVGIGVRTAANTWALKTIQSNPAFPYEVEITNGNGAAPGNIFINLVDNISGVNTICVANLGLGAILNAGTPVPQDPNTIYSTNANGNINFDPNGTGLTTINSSLDILAGNVIRSWNAGGTFYTALGTSAAQPASYTYLWPMNSAGAPILNTALSYGAAGQLFWQTIPNIPSATVANTLAYFTSIGGTLASTAITVSGATNKLSGLASITTTGLSLGETGSIYTITSVGGQLLLNSAVNDIACVNNLAINSPNVLKLYGTGGFNALKGANAGNGTTYILPTADGAANTIMITAGTNTGWSFSGASKTIAGVNDAAVLFTSAGAAVVVKKTANIASVGYAVGTYTINFNPAMASADYTVNVTIGGALGGTIAYATYSNRAVGSVIINTYNNALALTDFAEVSVTICNM